MQCVIKIAEKDVENAKARIIVPKNAKLHIGNNTRETAIS